MDCFAAIAITPESAFRLGFIALVGAYFLFQLFHAIGWICSVGKGQQRQG